MGETGKISEPEIPPQSLISEPETSKKLPGVDRITVKIVGEQQVVYVKPGAPMVLRGRSQGDESWEDVAVVSSNGGTVKLTVGKYDEFYLDPNVMSRMRFDPPVVTAVGQRTDATKPRIVS